MNYPQHKEHIYTQAELATNAETWKHINTVMQLLASAQIELMRRQFTHDQSKLRPPEVSTFTEYTPKLKESTYGSDEYKEMLTEMAPALNYHYAHNRHHPEYFKECSESEELNEFIDLTKGTIVAHQKLSDTYFHYEQAKKAQKLLEYLETKQTEVKTSVNGMNLFDILEMFIDWNAAVLRHANGDINKSIEINTKRFALSPQLVQIFKNTTPWIINEFEDLKTQQDL